jgi:site-specific DNA-adenine methylase/DNA polymerase I-like protein with 3'-5' exonuclease and polymerase domains
VPAFLCTQSTVRIGNQAYPYARRWQGERLLPGDGYLAFDTETEVVDLKRAIPRLALASASASEKQSCLVHPDDLGQFILTHRQLHIICHHATFDFWVVVDHLTRRGEEQARRSWWEIADKNRLHDSMLLDMLVRSAKDDSFPDPRNLAVVAKQYADLTITKEDPYRKRYGEIMGQDWDGIDQGFLDYAIRDAIVTRPTYLAIRKQALAVAEKFGRDSSDILPDARQKFGLLTEAVQVKKAIALAQIARNGMTVDLEWVRRTESDLREEMLQASAAAQAICPVYQVRDDGTFVTSGKTDTPAYLDKTMREQLAQIKEEIETATESHLNIPVTKEGRISRSVKIWADYVHLHPFLQHWIKAQNLAKLLQFFTLFQDNVGLSELAAALQVDAEDLAKALKAERGEDGSAAVPVRSLAKGTTRKNRKLQALGLEPEQVLAAGRELAEANRRPFGTVHPLYNMMVRTGRTSCSNPNIQQIPKDSAFRQSFVATPGYHLLAIDFSFIELRTFAATALHRYGWSDMANVIKAGVDPHAHTAAMMLGVPAEEFLRWKGNEAIAETVTMDGKEVEIRFQDKFDKARSQAKPVNFGVPGGLGVASLVSYAHSTYKVDFTLEQAKECRELLTKKIYKELDLYLAEDGAAIIARNLHAPLWEVRNELGDTSLSSARKILTGEPKRTDGKPYQHTFVSRVWASLAGLNHNPELTEALAQRQPSKELAARVCHAGVATLTGRIRGRVRYSQARNTPFQGLAADGAALALFELIKEGFRVIGFIHDEVLIELPDEGGHVSEAVVQRIEDILCRKMEDVLIGGIPVACEAALSTRWNKKAKRIVREGKVFPWEPEGQGPVQSLEANPQPVPCESLPAATEPVSVDHDPVGRAFAVVTGEGGPPTAALAVTDKGPAGEVNSEKIEDRLGGQKSIPLSLNTGEGRDEPLPTTEKGCAKPSSPDAATGAGMVAEQAGLVYSAYTGTSAELFPLILQLHVPPGSLVADATFGKGVFWKHVDPAAYRLLATDLATGTDCRQLPYGDGSLDCLILDPPFWSRRGNSRTHGDFEARYSAVPNNGVAKWHDAVFALYRQAGQEAARVLRRGGTLIIKCQDEVCSHRQRLTHVEIIDAYAAMGFYAKDLFILVRRDRPRVRLKQQQHARKNHSYFLVFVKRHDRAYPTDPPEPPQPVSAVSLASVQPDSVVSTQPERQETSAKAVPKSGKYPAKPLVWFGGSAPYAFDAVKRFPRHLHYVETFAGSAAVFFARDPQDKSLWLPGHRGVSEVLNDRLGNLVNFYRVLRDREMFAEFVRLVRLTPYGRPAFDAAVAHVYGSDCVQDALQFFVLNRMSRAGDMKGFRPITRSRTRGGINGDVNQYLGIVDGLEAFHQRLRQAVIENMDAVDLIKREDAAGTFYFVDPPYPQSVVNTVNGYELMMSDDEHQALIDSLVGIKGKAMIVCYAHPIYDALHLKHDWRQEHFDLVADTAGGDKKGKRELCVWTNYTN